MTRWLVVHQVAVFFGLVMYSQCETTPGARWEAATGIRPRARITWDDALPGGAYGLTNFRTGHVRMSRSTPVDRRVQTILHEFGHVVAGCAGHVKPYAGVMAERFEEGLSKITAADLELVCGCAPCLRRVPE